MKKKHVGPVMLAVLCFVVFAPGESFRVIGDVSVTVNNVTTSVDSRQSR